MGEKFWRCPRQLEGEAAFIVAGGPSVSTQDLELLRDRHVVAINDSFEAVPWAEFMFFADAPWWVRYTKDDARRARLLSFDGQIVTTCETITHDRVLYCKRVKPKRGEPLRLCDDPSELAVHRTSVTAAMNLLKHCGVTRIVVLGLDGKIADDGRIHHCAQRPVRAGQCFEQQISNLRDIAGPLKSHGIAVLNASPGSAVDVWPVMSLEQAIEAGQ